MNTGEPNFIYHYTDIPGMKGIIESKNFWATELSYLNDIGEPTYSLDVIRDFLSAWTPRKPALRKRRDTVLGLFNGPMSQEVRPGYVVCLSENADQLSQWRSYGRHGVSVGFDLDGLRDLHSSLGAATQIRRVIYQPSLQIQSLEDAVKRTGQRTEDILGLMGVLFEESAFFKHQAFLKSRNLGCQPFVRHLNISGHQGSASRRTLMFQSAIRAPDSYQ